MELRFEPGAGAVTGSVAVHGLPASALDRLQGLDLDGADGRRLLSVRTAAAGAELPAVLGDRWLDGEVLRFTPRLAFRAGLVYRARFDGARLDRLTGAAAGTTPVLDLRFEPAAPAASPATRVEAVYPSTEVLPENQLRLYVWFSGPMRRRDVARGIRLIDAATDEPVELPFVEIRDGLWDPSGRRLTLFFHPGRVKRGVGPRLALGPPLREGGRYRLEIDPGLRDAAGRPLAAGHVKSFAVGPPDRRSPEPAVWRISPPAAVDEPLRVDFPEPLDHGLLLRLLEVADAAGETLAGEAAIGRRETRWSFRPHRPWEPGSYRLRVATTLEDLAGNTPERLFDEATPGGREPLPPSRKRVEISFEIAAFR